MNWRTASFSASSSSTLASSKPGVTGGTISQSTPKLAAYSTRSTLWGRVSTIRLNGLAAASSKSLRRLSSSGQIEKLRFGVPADSVVRDHRSVRARRSPYTPAYTTRVVAARVPPWTVFAFKTETPSTSRRRPNRFSLFEWALEREQEGMLAEAAG